MAQEENITANSGSEAQVEETNGTGSIVFANDVVATIASLAASEVEGVVSLGGNIVSGLSEFFGKKNLTKGVKVDIADQSVCVDVSLNLRYGCRIQDVCRKVQESIKNAVENMTGLNVKVVNTYAQSIVFEKPEQEAEIAEVPEEQETEKE